MLGNRYQYHQFSSVVIGYSVVHKRMGFGPEFEMGLIRLHNFQDFMY